MCRSMSPAHHQELAVQERCTCLSAVMHVPRANPRLHSFKGTPCGCLVWNSPRFGSDEGQQNDSPGFGSDEGQQHDSPGFGCDEEQKYVMASKHGSNITSCSQVGELTETDTH